MVGRVVNALGDPLDGKGPIVDQRAQARRSSRAGRRREAAGQGVACHGNQGHRLDDPHRQRPERAYNRRPADRQDRHRGGYDFEPEGPGRLLHLRCHRPEALHRGGDREHARKARRDGVYDGGDRFGERSRAAAVYRSLRRLRDGRVFPGHQAPRAA